MTDPIVRPLFQESELLPLSGLAHMAFCERRWALIHLEQQWADNRFTAEGNNLHEKAHGVEIESRPNVLIRRTLPLCSSRLGLSGQADIVEFQSSNADHAVPIAGRKGLWQAFPIEYKRSKDRAGSNAYRVQLCAQAMCLEEMLHTSIRFGAVYDGMTKRRQQVEFTSAMRELVEGLAARMHHILAHEGTPKAVLKPACRGCSLAESCLPATLSRPRPVERYINDMLRESL